MKIRGVGRVEVSKTPKRVPKNVKIGGKTFKVSKQMFRTVWAMEHSTSRWRKKARLRR